MLATHDLAQLYGAQGKRRESARLLAELRKRTDWCSTLARCDVQQAVNLRADARFQKAVNLLQTIAARYPKAERLDAFGQLQAAIILCTLDRKHESEQALRLAAANAVKVGILLELAGDARGARDAWAQAIRRFPCSRCCHYASLARSIMGAEADKLEEMPYHPLTRSEFFYLGALLYEARADPKRSRQLFRLCVKEDPTLNWPAYLAKKRLQGSRQPSSRRKGTKANGAGRTPSAGP
ncbi:MAG: hypothetical protein JXR37_08370 [Kiritimatiellae bacterium]|nr:hypothetical protein [Kiritimatiellia bacterium]